MSDQIIDELMVPVSRYATVKQDDTLYDTITVLEHCHHDESATAHKHTLVLVVDDDGRVVGKVSLWDTIRALDVVEHIAQEGEDLSRFGFNPQLVQSMMVSHRVWNRSLEDLTRRVATRKVTEFMSAPGKNQIVDVGATFDEIVYKAVKGEQLSLLVKRGDEIVGVLEVIDIMSRVCQLVKETSEKDPADQS